MSANITLRLDPTTLSRLKHLAEDPNTSVSAWVRVLVSRTVTELDSFEPARTQALRALDNPVSASAHTQTADPRHDRARACIKTLWDQPSAAAVSAQVLQELHVNLVRMAGMDAAQSAERINDYLAWVVVDNDRSLPKAAVDVQARWRLSFRDSLIIAAAQHCGAAQLWSEGVSAGQRYGEVTVINPQQPS